MSAFALALGYAGYLGTQSWLYRAALGRAMGDLSRGNYAAAASQFAAMAWRRRGRIHARGMRAGTGPLGAVESVSWVADLSKLRDLSLLNYRYIFH